MSDADPGFGVYLHWPFCAAKCPYCDFNSHVRHDPPDQARFAAAFAGEIATTAARIGPRTVASVFIGGGTPSLMQPETVRALLDAVAAHWTLAPDAEITLEANPNSVEAARFRGYRDAGVDRISIGVQALDDAVLKMLGRLHTAKEALAAVALAQSIFERVSFDLIYARPRQTVREWQRELARALELGTEHLSLYQLTIEEGTPFFALHNAGKIVTPDPKRARALYDATQEMTAAAGLPAYEISNHARPGAESRHNLIYWRSGEYAGIGPGAHGRLMMAGKRIATAAERNPEDWLARVEATGHGLVTDEALTRAEQADEFLLMGLRLAEGISVPRFEAVSGHGFHAGRLARLIEADLVARTPDGRLRVTPEGFPVLDAVVADLAD